MIQKPRNSGAGYYLREPCKIHKAGSQPVEQRQRDETSRKCVGRQVQISVTSVWPGFGLAEHLFEELSAYYNVRINGMAPILQHLVFLKQV